MTIETQLVPVILSGGSGSRLWPVSREAHPKPFMQLPDGDSLLQKTFLRACQFANIAEILTITNEAYYLKHKIEYEKIAEKSPVNRFLLEPAARNTAPAIALAAMAISERYGRDTIMLVLPADHLIADVALFAQHAKLAFTLAEKNKLVTFGITPTSAETGFGYIECGEEISEHLQSHHVLQFIEKPNAQIAESLVASKRFLWNAGMFCFKAGLVLDELTLHAKPLLTAANTCWQAAHNKESNVIMFAKESFNALPDISIDYALMEKSAEIAVLKCDFDWQDIGSWEAYKKLHGTDQQGNTILGEAILIDAKDNFIKSDNRLIAAIGIDHLAIIDTPDALLITHRDRTQDVKQVVQTLKQKAHESYLQHRTVIRPWGHYTVLEEGPAFKIKRIVVHPHHTLSLQLHHHRSEHWIVVEGTAEVVNGEKTYQLQTNESTFVPKETPHRLSNPHANNLVIIEVQAGSYVGEDDIVRLEDVYGRVTS
jgi:mannose-1-phosphate guanylyltransferase